MKDYEKIIITFLEELIEIITEWEKEIAGGHREQGIMDRYDVVVAQIDRATSSNRILIGDSRDRALKEFRKSEIELVRAIKEKRRGTSAEKKVRCLNELRRAAKNLKMILEDD